MPVSSGVTNPDQTPESESDLMPIVSKVAREFLEGKIPASDYIESVRRDAAREAHRDVLLRREHTRRGTYVRAHYVRASGPPGSRLVFVAILIGVTGFAAALGAVGGNTEQRDSGLFLAWIGIAGVIAGVTATIIAERITHRK
jgi:hypothetical protein